MLALFASADAGRLFGDVKSINQRLIEQEILAGLLAHQPSNVSQFLDAGGSGPAAAHVKRAKRFIVEHADRSISLCDIASAAGVPIRTLQHGFRQTLGRSPMAVLRAERLMRVRCELASGHGGGSVTSVAAKWGFVHFGRFSSHYRQSFGELPSTTLVNANHDAGR